MPDDEAPPPETPTALFEDPGALAGELIDGAPKVPDPPAATPAQIPSPNSENLRPVGSKWDQWAGLTDRHGNRYDPVNLHQSRADGSPILGRGGRPMAKPGVKLTGAKSASAQVSRPAAKRSSSVDLAALRQPRPEDEERDEDDDDDDIEDDEEEAAPSLTAAEREILAGTDAEDAVELEALALETLAGEHGALTTEERAALQASAKRWFLQDNVEMPIRARGMHFVRLGRVAIKRINEPEVQERFHRALNATTAWILNRFNGSK